MMIKSSPLKSRQCRMKLFSRNRCMLVIAFFTTIWLKQTLAQTSSEMVLGWYNPDGKCVPSASCCCAKSPVNLAKSASGDGVVVTGDLDGGAGCRNFGSITSVFSVRYYGAFLRYPSRRSTQSQSHPTHSFSAQTYLWLFNISLLRLIPSLLRSIFPTFPMRITIALQ